jgi:parallel beta-helix repeat protein
MRAPIRVVALCAVLLLAAPPAAAKVLRVAAGESIQKALDEAKPGDVVEVEPGTYREALTVDTPDITLRGVVRGDARPVLDGGGELNDGVIASGSPFRMRGFRVQHYKGNGVTTQRVDGVYIEDLVVDDTGLYGVYPIMSRHIWVTHCTMTGIRDAAIYVGESRDALVAFNEVHQNVVGIQIENSSVADVRDNQVYDNTAGIVVVVLPLKLHKKGVRTRVHRNRVSGNNRPNAGDPRSFVGRLPSGAGILVAAADDTVVEQNRVEDNHSYGIAVVRLSKRTALRDFMLEPRTDRARIADNDLQQNGLQAHPSVVERWGRGADLIWDGSGRGNCFTPHGQATRAGTALTPCGEGRTVPADESSGAEPLGAPAPEAAPPAAEADHVVRIRGMRYEPKHLQVRPGETVRWVNEDAVPHTVTSSAGREILRAPLDSSYLMRGDAYDYTFPEAGRFEYLCVPHMDQAPMREATVTVVE